jgi:hypothetical protein
MQSLRGLTKEEVEKFYDRFGAKQDNKIITRILHLLIC